MSVNNAEEEYSSSRSLEEIESPRKRMRMDTSSRKSWSLMDRKTDHEVLQEMGVSLLESDDGDPHSDHCHHRPLKRKHNIENVNPNANSSPSPAPSPSPSPRKPCSPLRAPAARRPSRHSSEKSRPETSVEGGAGSQGAADEETPLAQSVSHVAPLALQQRRHNTPPAGGAGGAARAAGAGGARWQPSGPDAFAALSDEVMLSVCRWLPKRTLAHCMLLSRRWHRIACDETLWQRLDLGHKALCAGALPRVLRREPVALRLAGAEIGAWGAGEAGEEAEAEGEGAARVQYLDLSMAAVDVDTLNQLLRRCPALRKLSLEGLQLDDRTCDIIGSCAELETLNLTMSRGVSGAGLARVLRGARRLAALNVAWSCLAPHALQELCSRAGGSRLQRLNLAGARALTDDMVADLARSWPALVELDLSDCPRLTAACLPALCSLPRLEHLALSRCYLLPAGALASLRAGPRLQYVEAWGMLSAAALAALRAALPHLQLNQYMFSAIARPTVGTRRTSIWGLRTRD